MSRTLIGLILVVVFFTGFGILGWYFVKERIRKKQEYLLSAEKIVVSPSPDWVPDRFVEDVLRNSGLNQTGSLLDNALPQKLMEAFSSFPWVEKVEHVVLRYPSGAEIKLSYRVPVALVEVPQRGLLPVDRNGVVLPTDYLSGSISDLLNNHLIIQGIQSTPLGSAGTPWGDPQVHSASQLASALLDDDNVVESLKLKWIHPSKQTLKTAGGTEFYWGSFVPDVSSIEAKKKKLWKLSKEFQSLDRVPAHFRDLSQE